MTKKTESPEPKSEKTLAKKPESIREWLLKDEFKNQVALALPKHITPDRFIRVALTAMTKTPRLAECDQHSFFSALLTLSQLGLEPDGRLAHLIPFRNNKRNCVECQLIVDYKGLAALAMRSGNLSKIHADKVCENDVFEYDKGEVKAHKIDFRKDRGAPYAYYALVVFKDGAQKADVMPLHDVQAIRKRSRAANDGPWITDFDEMAKKTVFRRLSKWLELSPEYRDALDADADSLEEKRFASSIPANVALPNFSDEPTSEKKAENGGENSLLEDRSSEAENAVDSKETPNPKGESTTQSDAERVGGTLKVQSSDPNTEIRVTETLFDEEYERSLQEEAQ